MIRDAWLPVAARLAAGILAIASLAFAQGPPPGGGGRGGGMDHGPGGGPRSRGGPPSDNRSSDALSGKWWTNPMTIRRLGLSEDQQKRLDQIYQQNRLRLIDLRAALEKEEATMEPLLASDHPAEASVFAQIDRIANARADLEKANARMLFAFRLVLFPEQWRELQLRDPGPGRH
jgi:Spy/CpxP family protein refolding chaperone